jgi:hypothetical protein
MAVCGASAGRNNMIAAVNGKQYPLFYPAQDHMPILIDYILQCSAFGSLDEDIAVYETFRGEFGQDNADGAFSRSRHADQYDIFLV